MPEQAGYDVRIWEVRVRKGRQRTGYVVRWLVDGRNHQKTFATRKLADAFRAQLTVAAKGGQPFGAVDGLPISLARGRPATTWYEHASAFIDSKWGHVSARHRKSLAEGLTTVTCALVAEQASRTAPGDLRAALMGWAFNRAARGGAAMPSAEPPTAWADTLRWIERNSEPMTRLSEPRTVHRALEAIATTLDGRPASAATVRRKRSALYSALAYAVELDLLATNPLDKLRWTQPAHSDVVDRRVVVNPEQARRLIGKVRQQRPALEAFFACIYFAAMRPSEVRHLRLQDCELSDSGWGTLLLAGSTQEAGLAWTDSGQHNEDRALKHRARRQIRPVPASPELVAILRHHIEVYPPGAGGRLFVTRTGRAGVPLAPPYAKPVSMSTVYRTWAAARQAAFTDAEAASPLARRPYDLRHAAVSLWLNAGVPAAQVAEWAGHSVHVLLRVYASCISGEEALATSRVQAALGAPPPPPPEASP